MRLLLLSISLLMCACSSQPTPVIADYETPPASVSGDWECDPKSGGLWSCSAPRAPETVAMAELPSAAESSARDDAFALQVGAFRDRDLAEKAVRQIGMPDLQIVATRREDADWYVLLLGTYPSAVEAREAGETYLDANPGGAIWVRAASDLKASLTGH